MTCVRTLLARSMAAGWLAGKLLLLLSGQIGSNPTDLMDQVEAQIGELEGRTEA